MNTAKRAYKPRTDQCKAWKVEGAVNADCLAGEATDGMTVEAKTSIFKEWIRMRLGNTKPDTLVLSMTLVVNSGDYSGQPGECRIRFTGYFQTKHTSVNPLKAWMGDCKWTQMNGGLCGNTEFRDDMEKSFPWVIVPVFSKVALNNAGRKEQYLQKSRDLTCHRVACSRAPNADLWQVASSDTSSRNVFLIPHNGTSFGIQFQLHAGLTGWISICDSRIQVSFFDVDPVRFGFGTGIFRSRWTLSLEAR